MPAVITLLGMGALAAAESLAFLLDREDSEGESDSMDVLLKNL